MNKFKELVKQVLVFLIAPILLQVQTKSIRSAGSDCREIKDVIYFQWTIHNYSLLHEDFGKLIDSPQFPLDKLADTKWHLVFFPTDFSNLVNVKEYTSLFLFLDDTSRPYEDVTIKYGLQFPDGSIFQSGLSVITKLTTYASNSIGTLRFATGNQMNDAIWPDDSIKILFRINRFGNVNNYQCYSEVDFKPKLRESVFPINEDNFTDICDTMYNPTAQITYESTFSNAIEVLEKIWNKKTNVTYFADERIQKFSRFDAENTIDLYTDANNENFYVGFTIDIKPPRMEILLVNVTFESQNVNFSSRIVSLAPTVFTNTAVEVSRVNKAFSVDVLKTNFVDRNGNIKLTTSITVIDEVSNCKH